MNIMKSSVIATAISFAIAAPSALADWEVVEGVDLNSSRQLLDRSTRQFKSVVTVTNSSETALEGPLRLMVENATLSMSNMDGLDDNEVPYMLLAEGLGAGESTQVQLSFDFARARLSFDLSLQQDVEEDSLWTLVWQDEFDGDAVDLSKWSFEENCWGGGNNEQQCYTDRGVNSSVGNGVLTITAQREDFTGPDNPDGNLESQTTLPYTSARLRTLNKGDWTYGRFEIRAKMPFGQGTWPAIWMLPTDYVYGGWAASGEIDIMEAVNLKAQSDALGAEPGDEENRIHGTLHYGRSWPNNVNSGTDYSLPGGVNPADGFHEYAIEWEDGEIRWYVDDIHYATHTEDGWYAQFQDENGVWQNGEGSAPFNERFHMILNLAVGGSWAANVNETGIDESIFPQQMQVDYVRVYECSVNPSNGQGCATVGEDAELIEGNQPPVIVDPEDNIGAGPVFNLYTNALAAGFAYDSFNPNGSISYVEVAEEGRGNVIQLSQVGNIGNLFFSGPGAFSMGHFEEYGRLAFDLKVVSNEGDAQVLVKVDSGWPFVSDYSLQLPEGNDWQSYSISVAEMLANGNSIAPGNFADIANVTNPFVIEPNAPITLMLDNVRYEYGFQGIDEVVVYQDADNPPYQIGQFVANGSVIMEDVLSADAEYGTVKQLTFNTNESVVYWQTQADNNGSTIKLDMSNFDTLEFDVLVLEDPREIRNFMVKMDCGFPCGTGDYPIEAAPIGQWTNYQIPLADLVAHPGSTLNLSQVDTPLVIFPAWGNQLGVVMQVDNVRVVGDGNDDNSPPTEVIVTEDLVIFDDDFADTWNLWDCCGNAAVSVVADELRGMVANVDFFGPSPTVSGLQAGLVHDLSAISNGTLSFDFKLVSPSNSEIAQYLIKLEGTDGSFAELLLSESNEGLPPAVGEWQTFTYDLSELSNAGLSLDKLHLILMFPTWNNAQGAVYQLDNVRLNQ